jgi:hypothetical protein
MSTSLNILLRILFPILVDIPVTIRERGIETQIQSFLYGRPIPALDVPMRETMRTIVPNNWSPSKSCKQFQLDGETYHTTAFGLMHVAFSNAIGENYNILHRSIH